MKQRVEAQSGEEVEVVLSEEDTEETEDLAGEETEDLAGDENPDNPDGWAKSGARPKKQRRNKKKRNNQSPFQTSIRKIELRIRLNKITVKNIPTVLVYIRISMVLNSRTVRKSVFPTRINRDF